MLPDWLAHRAATTPDRIGLIAGGRDWSYATLDAEATRTAWWLRGLGLHAGDRVATLLPNGSGPVALAHAVLRLGAILVPLNLRLGDPELAWQLQDCGARLLVVDERTIHRGERVRGDRPLVAVARLGDAHADAGAAMVGDLRAVHDPATVLAIIYTSGTTGRPKGAMLTVGNIWWSALGSAMNLGSRTDDRWLACLPLFHIGGLSIVFRAAIHGFTAVVHEVFDPVAVNRAIDDERVTIVSVVAVMLERMLEQRGDRPFPPSLRCVLLGGGPAPRALLARCLSLGVPVAQTYGLTETASQVATLSPEDAVQKPGAAGRALYPNEIRIAAAGGDAATGEAGEILVRGPVVMAGYHGHRTEAIADGWLHTGDIGHLDAEGVLHVLDRRDDLIITGGENVYAAEVEAALLEHPAVAEAGVIGAADARWGQRVVAIVRLHPSPGLADTETLRTHCAARIARFKVPAEIRIVEDPLPRTASGKLRRAELRTGAASST